MKTKFLRWAITTRNYLYSNKQCFQPCRSTSVANNEHERTVVTDVAICNTLHLLSSLVGSLFQSTIRTRSVSMETGRTTMCFCYSKHMKWVWNEVNCTALSLLDAIQLDALINMCYSSRKDAPLFEQHHGNGTHLERTFSVSTTWAAHYFYTKMSVILRSSENKL